MRSMPSLGSFGGGEKQRQHDADRRPLPLSRALGAHRAAVKLDQPLDDRQPQSQSAPAASERSVALTEALKHVRHQLRLNPDAGVLDREHRLRTILSHLYP